MLDAHKENESSELLKIGITTWYTGIACQMSYKKASYKQWIEQFTNSDKVEQERKKDLEGGKELWQVLAKS